MGRVAPNAVRPAKQVEMRYLSILCMLIVFNLVLNAQSSVGDLRSIRYTPEGDDLVIHNGKVKFNRALYGTNTGFRIETGDVPEFALYLPGMGGNLSFSLVSPDTTIALNDLLFVESRYRAGTRIYSLNDPLLGKGELTVQVLAFAESEGMLVRITTGAIAANLALKAVYGGASNKRFSRHGDLGVDPADSFELKAEYCAGNTFTITGTAFALQFGKDGAGKLTGEFPQNAVLSVDETGPKLNASFRLGKYQHYYIWIKVPDQLPVSSAEQAFQSAEQRRKELSSTLHISTPDKWISPLGGILSTAADGIWDGQVWQHGAVGWRMPLNGWRAAYTGDVLGWHDRSRRHFEAYAASQLTDVPARFSHPYQDSSLNMARAAKVWGTPMYSNGYICRNPERNDQMHHYDMNLVYVDQLLWHLKWTGDTAFARTIWPLLRLHLEWEKRNFDPDDDGLYNAYACIWASDALYYNSGGVTHASAYNHRANRMAAEVAELIGEDPNPYLIEAAKISRAVNNTLWLSHKGYWAEFVDFMGYQQKHESAAVWTIYHAIDGELADPFQAYQATRYIDKAIPHIAVNAPGLPGDYYHVISSSSWMPYSWSVNNVALAEIYHTALAYWQAGRREEAFLLLKSAVLDNMYLGQSPGNIGQISHYDAARGECYRDFGDPVGILSRTIVQGLYGILPDALKGELTIQPGFPSVWNHASIDNGTVSYSFNKTAYTTEYKLKQRFKPALAVKFILPVSREHIREVMVNNAAVPYQYDSLAIGQPRIVIRVPATGELTLTLVEDGKLLDTNPQLVTTNDPLLVDKTEFRKISQGSAEWYRPVHYEPASGVRSTSQPSFKDVDPDRCEPVCIDSLLTTSVDQIFKQQYLSPRSPYTTLQIPVQGIGEWCHPLLTATINDSGLRASSPDNLFTGPSGVVFRSMQQGPNIAFVSLWDNYPDSITVPLSGTATRAYLMMAGTTNHMQYKVDNGWIVVDYTHGPSDTLRLVNPDNWCPIEQDFYTDNNAFRLESERHWRVSLLSGKCSQDLGKEFAVSGVYGRSLPGGAGVLLDLKLDEKRELKRLTLHARANEVILGLMSLSLQRVSAE